MRFIDVDEWEELVDEMYLKCCDKQWQGIYGVPRGGTLIAISLSYKLHCSLLKEPIKGCLVVDDLIDSGRTMEKFKEYEFLTLIDKRQPEWKGQWIEFWFENTQQDAEDLVIRQLEFIGENPNREGLKDTPKRVVKMWMELFNGYNENEKPNVTIFDNGKDGINYDQIITDEGYYFSFCEHHMIPFFGKYYFGYIPDKKILGLSKVARVVDYFSAKLQIQERLCDDIVQYLNEKVNAKGMILLMEGRHLCKEMRGVKKINGIMKTSKVIGIFSQEQELEQKFLQIIK